MSSHSGVACDSCMKTNFAGRRYKCLLCDNYDLCGVCYDVEAETQNHKKNHPMQCILTETASELFYAGESIPRRTVVSLTCPHCCLSGFIPRTLLTHCIEKHPTATTLNKPAQAVMCPICVTSATYANRSRYTLLTDHIVTTHDDGSGGGGGGGGDEFSLISTSLSQNRRGQHEEEDSDEDDDEEEEEPSLNDLEHRAFVEEEQRRQEATRQRLSHASSLSAVIRNDYASALSGNANSQRRPLSRQTAIRGPRGGLRGHFNHYPYGVASRAANAFASNTTQRNSSDAPQGTSSQPSDPYAAFVFAQDPMLEFVSLLVNNQQSSTNSSSNQYIFGHPSPMYTPSSASSSNTPSEFARLQQQLENSEPMAPLKSSFLNVKQKRSSHTQQQQQTSIQSVNLNHPSGYDYQLWQQHFPALQPTLNNPNFVTRILPNELTTGNSNINTLLKHSQQLNREHDSRSLIGKIFRNETNGVNNKDETNEMLTRQRQDHLSFLQSILLSTMIKNLNIEEN